MASCGWIVPSGDTVLFASTHLDPEAEAKQARELAEKYGLHIHSVMGGGSTAGLHAAVGAQHHAAAQAVLHQHLMGFGHSDFPRRTGVFDRGER